MTIVDPELTTLADALSAAGQAEVMALTGLEPSSNASDRQVEVVKHVPGQRATLFYKFEGRAEASCRLTGKVYRSRRRAARIYHWLGTLEAGVFPPGGNVRVPHPVALSDALSMVLLEYIDGVDLRHVLEPKGTPAFNAAARWLAALHDSPVLDESRVRTVADEIQKAIGWLDEVAPHVPYNVAARLGSARGRLVEIAASPPRAELCTVHRDYYYANVLWDGARLWGIDLDQLRTGDPALDVGHFLAHLETLAFVQTGDFGSLEPQAERFLQTYVNLRPPSGVIERIPLYKAYTFFKLAATAASRTPEGWRDGIDALSQRALEELASSHSSSL